MSPSVVLKSELQHERDGRFRSVNKSDAVNQNSGDMSTSPLLLRNKLWI